MNQGLGLDYYLFFVVGGNVVQGKVIIGGLFEGGFYFCSGYCYWYIDDNLVSIIVVYLIEFY